MTVYAVRRETKKGPRWYVRCELPADINYEVFDSQTGEFLRNLRPIIHLGTFETEKSAKARIASAKAEVDAGRIPKRFPDAPIQTTTLARAATEWLDTRHDITETGQRQYAALIRGWPKDLAGADPPALTHTDVQAWVTALAKKKKRGSIQREIGVLRMVLDYTGVSPNPARDPRVKLPRAPRKVHRLPTRDDIAAMHAAMPTRVELMLLLEHTGLRIHEAAALKWRDFDRKHDRLLVASSKTTAGTRWVDRLKGAPEFPVMPDGADANSLVFGSPSALTLTNVMHAANRKGLCARFSAHDFRHLHCSRLLHEGALSPAQIAARVGHATPAITLTTYSHLMPPD